MMTMKTMLDQLTGEDTVQGLIDMLAEKFEDFAEDRRRCDEAVAALEEEVPAVEEEIKAIHKQVTSNLLFAGFLGFQANLDHFLDPVKRTFLDVDFEIYLREGTAKQLPEYIKAQNQRDHFAAALSPAQRERYEDITEFGDYLETVVPKLAHYYGFMLANELLPRVMPGYAPDLKLAAQYRRMLEDYLGTQL